jgi:hypothetical protein
MQMAFISVFTITYHVFLAAPIQSPVSPAHNITRKHSFFFFNTTCRSSNHSTVKTANKFVHFTTNFQNAGCGIRYIYPHFPTAVLLQSGSFTLKHTLRLTSYIWEWFIIEINVNFATIFLYHSGIFFKLTSTLLTSSPVQGGVCVEIYTYVILHLITS